jgi:ligand-binding sensor domain-containing protein
MADRNTGNPVPAAIVPDQALPFTIHLFIPATNSIHSTQIMDLISAKNGDVLIATPSGISTYNGSWDTRSVQGDTYSPGLYDNFVTALEYDYEGNLWIGYANGIQIFDGKNYRLIRDQQMLKDLRITDLQRWNDDMWVLNGNAGIHRYHEGNWSWFVPYSSGGPGFYTGRSMAIDSADNSLLIATQGEGLWRVRQTSDTIQFVQLQGKDDTYGNMLDVRKDPVGGAYFFNNAEVVHYDFVHGFKPVFPSMEGNAVPPVINDVAASPDGTLYVATDDGIRVLENQKIVALIGRFEGIGTSQIVKTVHIDAQNRVWFSTADDVGYFTVDSGSLKMIPIDTVTHEVTETNMSPEIPDINQSFIDEQAIVLPVKQVSLIDTVLGAISHIIQPINPYR